jgi:hypothetical protein
MAIIGCVFRKEAGHKKRGTDRQTIMGRTAPSLTPSLSRPLSIKEPHLVARAAAAAAAREEVAADLF